VLESTAARLGIPALVMAALCWSLGGALIKLVDLPPMVVAGWRSLIAGVFIMCIRGAPGFPRDRVRWAAAASYALCVILFVVATKMTTAANAILLQFTAPIYVALLAPVLLKEPTSRLDWAAIVVVMSGIGLFFIDRLTVENILGNIAGLASGLFYALTLLSFRLQRGNKPYFTVIQGNFLAALLCLPWMLLTLPSAGDIPGLLMLGIFQLAFGYYLYSWAAQYVGAVTAILVTVLEPLLNPMWTYLAVGELPGRYSIMGGVIVLGAVIARGLLMIRSARPPLVPRHTAPSAIRTD
jgi:drug/metabolite transporter (DMT)-like permease